MDYLLFFRNIQRNREEWQHRYPTGKVIYELIFKDDCILVYAGSRPSASVDRRYSFILDLSGKVVPGDPGERRKQEERDSSALACAQVGGFCKTHSDYFA